MFHLEEKKEGRKEEGKWGRSLAETCPSPHSD